MSCFCAVRSGATAASSKLDPRRTGGEGAVKPSDTTASAESLDLVVEEQSPGPAASFGSAALFSQGGCKAPRESLSL
ncbi:unnamed protein product [Lampetra planeri]